MHSVRQGYRPEIDGLRALAVIAVIINHIDSKLLPSGFLGVDIFFVISGYVITASLLHRPIQGFRSFIISFYARRFRRILPALVVFVLIASVLICFVSPDPAQTLNTGMAALAGFSNLYLYLQSSNYFSQDATMNMFLQTWSLGVEEQFYLVYPLLFWLFLRKGATRRRILSFAFSLAVLAVFSWFFYCRLVSRDLSAAYYLSPVRFWEMSAGAILLLVSIYLPRRIKAFCAFPVPVLLGLIGLLFVPSLQFGIYKLTTAVVLTTCVLIIGLQPNTAGHSLLSAKPFVGIGLISYSLYLWHWGVLCFGRWTVGINRASILPVLFVIFLLSFLSYKYVETPCRRVRPDLSPKAIMAAGGGALLVTTFVSLFLSRWMNQGLFSVFNGDIEASEQIDGSQLYYKCDFFRGFRVFRPDRDVRSCTYLPVQGPGADTRSSSVRTLYYLGNSHVAMMTGLISELRKQAPYRQTILYTGAIKNPPIPSALMLPPWDDDPWTPKGIKTQEKIMSAILSLSRPGDVLVLGNDLASFAVSDSSRSLSRRQLAGFGEWLSRMRELADLTDEKRIEVVILLPGPLFDEPRQGFSTKACAKSLLRPEVPSECLLSAERSHLIRRFANIRASLQKIAVDKKNVHLFSGFDILCPPQNVLCTNYNADGFTFRDGTHLNNRGSALLAPSFLAFLRELPARP